MVMTPTWLLNLLHSQFSYPRNLLPQLLAHLAEILRNLRAALMRARIHDLLQEIRALV